MKKALLALLDLYRAAVRPFMRPACRFHPSCADYARKAVVAHGALRGARLAALRLLRCHPFHPGGVDLVPPSPSTRT